MNVTPSKKSPIDWSDKDADEVLKSVLSVVSPDMRKAAERDIRDLMARAWLLGEATRTVRPEGTASGMVMVPRSLLHRIQVLCGGDLGVQVALHNILAVDAEDAPKPQESE